MIDQSVKLFAIARHCHPRGQVTSLQAYKLAADAARSYTDDADVSHGFLSTQSKHFRPGQRDDARHCSFIGMIPTVQI